MAILTLEIYFSLKQIVARKEATRLRNQATIQAIIDGAVGEKEDAWNAILGLKFEVRKADIDTDMPVRIWLSP